MGLKPLEQRNISADEVINRLRPKLNSLPGAVVFLQSAQDLRIGGRQSRSEYQYTIQSDNVRDLVAWGPALLRQMKKLSGFTDVNSDQQNNGLEAMLDYDRATASRMGITPRMIDNTLYDAFGQAEVSTMYTSLNQYYVVMEVAPHFWQSPLALNDIYITPTVGPAVPLGAITHFAPTTAPLAVNHQGQFPSVTVSFNLAQGMALSDAAREIDEMEQKMGMPESIRGMFSGTLQAYQQSLSTEPILIITALLSGLHRSRRSVRKLHSPDHHTFHASFRRRRRGAGANAVPYRLERHCTDRNHFADRHRQEERHSDDRFRDHRRTDRTQKLQGSHLSGVPAAFPTHSHDHHGGPIRRTFRSRWAPEPDRNCAARLASPSSAA